MRQLASAVGLDPSPIEDGDTIGRLCRLARHQRGRVMETVRRAAIATLKDGRETIEKADLAEAHRKRIGDIDASTDIMFAEDWRSVPVRGELATWGTD